MLVPYDYLVLLNSAATVRTQTAPVPDALSFAYALFDVKTHTVVYKALHYLDSPDATKERLEEARIPADDYNEAHVPLKQAVAKLERKMDEHFASKGATFAVVVENLWDLEECLLPMAQRHQVAIPAGMLAMVYDVCEEVANSATLESTPAGYAQACAALNLDQFGKDTDSLDVCVNLANLLTKLGGQGYEMALGRTVALSQNGVVAAQAASVPPTTVGTSVLAESTMTPATPATVAPDSALDASENTSAPAMAEHSQSFQTYSTDGTLTGSRVVRVRGLPWQCSQDDIKKFFEKLNVIDIHFDINHIGRSTGEAYVMFVSPTEATEAVKLDHQHIGHRYVEVASSTEDDMNAAVRRARDILTPGSRPPPPIPTAGVVKLRGLPYSVRETDIEAFFVSLRLQRDGIHLARAPDGRLTGEAFVEFTHYEDIPLAMRKQREKIGSRYIELFPSNPDEMAYALKRAAMSGGVSSIGGGQSSMQGGYYGTPAQSYMPPPSQAHMPQYSQPPPQYHQGPPPPHHMGRPDYGRTDAYDPGAYSDVFLRVRGLPYSATEQDLMAFFMTAGATPIGIQLLMNSQGRKSGDGYVQFTKPEDAQRGLLMHRQPLGQRYVEVFHASPAEVIAAVNAQSQGLHPDDFRKRPRY